MAVCSYMHGSILCYLSKPAWKYLPHPSVWHVTMQNCKRPACFNLTWLHQPCLVVPLSAAAQAVGAPLPWFPAVPATAPAGPAAHPLS